MAPPPKKSGGLSLYADLLEPEKKGAIIPGAPVKYDLSRTGSSGDEAAKARKKDGTY